MESYRSTNRLLNLRGRQGRMGWKRSTNELVRIFAEPVDTENRVVRVWGWGWARFMGGDFNKKDFLKRE